MRAVLLAVMLGLAGCGQKKEEGGGGDLEPVKRGDTSPAPPKPEGKLPPEAVAPKKQYTLLLFNEQDFKREGDALYRNESAGLLKPTWVKMASDPTVLLMGEIAREYQDNELKATRKYQGKVARVIGTADKVAPQRDGTVNVSVVSLVGGTVGRVQLNFPGTLAETLENVKHNDMIVADGTFRAIDSYEKCRLVSFKTPRMEGGVYTGHQIVRDALKLP